MKLASLRAGQDLILNAVPYRLVRILQDGLCQLERKSDLALINYKKAELLALLTSGQLSLSGHTENKANRTSCDLSSLPESNRNTITRRLNYVRAIENLTASVNLNSIKPIIERVANEIADPQPPSPPTVYRWWKRWKESGQSAQSLNCARPGPKKASERMPAEAKGLILRLTQEIYLQRAGGTVQDVFDAVCSQFSILNQKSETKQKPPSRATIYRFIKSHFDAYTIMAAQEGKPAADRHFRATGQGVVTQYILERAEVDHTPLDLIVIDEITGQTLGRPTVTFITDRHSGLPLSFEAGFEPPSELVVMRALRTAILPKSNIKALYPEVENEWPAYGIPSTLVCDNGLEFHSTQLQRMCAELNIELVFCPRRQPHYKGGIERFLGTFNRQLSHKVAGTTYSNITDRGDYPSEAEASITLNDFKKLMHVWVVDVFNMAKHRELGLSPLRAWQDGLNVVEPVLPESKEKLSLILSVQLERKLNHEGIQFKGLMYNSNELAALRKMGVENCQFRIDPENISEIWVYDKFQNDYFKVPCTYAEYANNLTLAQHLLIRQHSNQTNSARHDVALYQRGKEKLRLLIAEARDSKQLKQRKKAARYNSPELKADPHTSNSIADKPSISEQSISVADIPDFDIEYKGD